MATGGDDRDRFEDDWFEEPAGEPAGGFRDPEAETWLEDEPEDGGGPGDRRPLIAAIAVAVVLVLAGIGIARIVGGDDDGEPAATAPGTTAPTATGGTGTGTDTGETPTEPVSPATTVPEDTTLRSGDEGEPVTLLQQALTSLGYDVGTPDGVFGPGTQEAVRQFQADAGLDADGIAGPATLAAVNEALAAGG